MSFAPIKSPIPVPGIAYSRLPGLAVDRFRCETWRATLTVPTCANRWREAQVARKERAEELRLCASCRIGASHAGEPQITRSRFYGTNLCPRCHRGSPRRLILNLICISCYNRQRELFQGRNAKGTLPSKLAPLFRIPIRFDVRRSGSDHRVIRSRSAWAVDLPEAVIAQLRNTQGQIRFGYACASRHVRQGRLF